MHLGKFYKTGIMGCIILSMASISCKNDNPVALPNPTYTITYNGNANTGGTVPTDDNKYAQGATVTVKANTGTLVRTGYTFGGWNTLANGSGNSYAASGSATFIMGSANVTLYGTWTQNGIDFHITNPKNGDAFNMGTPVTVKWTLPADGSIDTVILYRILQGQPMELLNEYMPVVAPADTFQFYISSDAPGQDFKLGIRNKTDTTQFDEITIHENGYTN
jgi:uncharacterized repeat protein (TIGR02543 family)